MGQGDERLRYKEVATGAKVGQWTTTQYTGHMGGEKVEEVWAATWEELGAPGDDFTIMVHMGEMFASVGQRMPAYFQFGRLKSTDQFPVVVLTYEDGKQTERSEIQLVEQKDIPASRFDLPKGLTKKTVESAPGQ